MAFALAVFSVAPARGEDFTPECHRIGLSNGSIVNVEFSPGTKFASWAQSFTYRQGSGGWTQDYWVSQVSESGDFIPADGKYTQISDGVNWGIFAYWGFDEESSAVYTSDIDNRILEARVNESTGDIVLSELTLPADRRPEYIYASRINSAETIYLVYLKSIEINKTKHFQIFWMDTQNPTQEHQLFVGNKPYSFPQDFFSNPRWVPDRRTFVFPFFDEATNAIQVAAHNIVSGQSYLLTSDAGNKVDPFPFKAPEHPGEWLMAAVIDETKIGIYRFPGDGPPMSLVKVIDIPSDFKYEQSAETFVWDGRTYVSTGVNDQPPKSRLKSLKRVKSELWIADIDPDSDFSRKVNTEEVGYTLDPETNVTPSGVWMYGYQRPPRSDYHELQKCRTGFGN